MNNVVITLALSFLIGSSLFLRETRIPIKSRMGSKFGQIGLWTVELAALEHVGITPLTYNRRTVLTTLVPLLSNGSSSFFKVTRPTIKAWMSLNLGKIPSLTSELAPLECLKNQ